MSRRSALWLGAAAVAVLSVAVLWFAPSLKKETGTLVVVAAGRSAGALAPTPLQLLGSNGWTRLGSVQGSVPAAPQIGQLSVLTVGTGSYSGVRLGTDQAAVSVVVAAGQVEPLMLGIEGGRLIPGGVYAGNDQLNLGLGELSGKFVPMPAFALEDQQGRPFDNQSTAGQDIVVAAFHTTCHQTCPLYTALFAQLAKRVPGDVVLAEVTTDPQIDTPAVLSTYAGRLGARWTFATGSPDALTSFWRPLGVELSSGDSHVSTLALIDRHGYVRLVYRGVPNVGNAIEPSLVTSLSAEGLHELASGGDGWGAPDVLQALLTIGGPQQAQAGSGGKAPAFSLASTDGGSVSLATLAGRPLVVNFWASYCPPCRAEMPMLVRDVGGSKATLVLIDEGDSAEAATAFLRALGVEQPSLLDQDLSVGRAYGVSALPMTVFVSPDGTVAARNVGQLDERVLQAQLTLMGQ